MKAINRVLMVVGMAGCSVSPDGATTTRVDEPNELGVVSIETARFFDGDDSVYELRGLTSSGVERASVRVRIGVVPELPGDAAAEVLLTIDGETQRMITRETQRIALSSLDARGSELLHLGAVEAALDDAKIIVKSPEGVGGIPPEGLYGFGGWSECPAQFVNTSPVAAQCCYSIMQVGHTAFVNPQGFLVMRYQNGFGEAGKGCKAADGVSPCDGAACYYGPNGFSRPTLYQPSAGNAWKVEPNTDDWSNPNLCRGRQYATGTFAPYFPTITGTFPTSQGCPGGGTGAGQWDY